MLIPDWIFAEQVTNPQGPFKLYDITSINQTKVRFKLTFLTEWIYDV
jgi:hypothetical protein